MILTWCEWGFCASEYSKKIIEVCEGFPKTSILELRVAATLCRCLFWTFWLDRIVGLDLLDDPDLV